MNAHANFSSAQHTPESIIEPNIESTITDTSILEQHDQSIHQPTQGHRFSSL